MTITLDIESALPIGNNEYYKVCNKSQLIDNKGIRVNFGDEFGDYGDIDIAIIKCQDKIFAVSNICPHKHAPKIFEGIVTDNSVICPLHGWKYSLETGENLINHDGIKKLDIFEILIKDETVYLKRPKLKIPLWRQS
ncbi:MAG: nitrite reductase small subunit NirD [Candidatus Kapaibacteriales bacterium]